MSRLNSVLSEGDDIDEVSLVMTLVFVSTHFHVQLRFSPNVDLDVKLEAEQGLPLPISPRKKAEVYLYKDECTVSLGCRLLSLSRGSLRVIKENLECKQEKTWISTMEWRGNLGQLLRRSLESSQRSAIAGE